MAMTKKQQDQMSDLIDRVMDLQQEKKIWGIFFLCLFFVAITAIFYALLFT